MGLISWVKDVFDANSEEDRRKRVARGDAEWYADYQKQKGNSRVSNNPWQRAVNTTKATVDNASKVYDTLNIFDNGLSYKTRKVDPNAVMSTGEQFRDLLDSDTKKDQYNRYKKTYAPWKIPQSYEEQQKQMGNMRPFVNPAQQMVGNSARYLNTVGQVPAEVIDTTRLGVAQLTNNQEASKAINNQILTRQNQFYDPKSGLLNAGTWYDNAEQARQSTTGDSLKRGAITSLGTAGEVFPVGKGVNLTKAAAQGAKVGVPQFLKVAGQGAVANAAAEAGNMQMQFGRIDPLALGVAAAAGGAMSVAPPLAYTGVRRAAPKATANAEKFVDDAAKEVTKAVQGARNAVKNATKSTKEVVDPTIRQRRINTAIKTNQRVIDDGTAYINRLRKLLDNKDLPKTQRQAIEREIVAKSKEIATAGRNNVKLQRQFEASKSRRILGGQTGFVGNNDPTQPTIKNILGEDVPNPAYKTPDSVAALKLTEEQYLTRNGAGFMQGSEPALHQNKIATKTGQKSAVERTAQTMSENNVRRAELRKEYRQKVANGEIVAPTKTDELVARANGFPDLESTKAARRLLDKRGIDWENNSRPTPHPKPEVAQPKVEAPVTKTAPGTIDQEMQEVIDAAQRSLDDGDIDMARQLADTLPDDQRTLIMAKADEVQEAYEQKVLADIHEELAMESTSRAGTESADIAYVNAAKKLVDHLKAPKSKYKFTGFKRTYQNADKTKSITVGGRLEEALDRLFFATDEVAFNRNIEVLSDKFGGVFRNIKESIDAGVFDDGDYTKFIGELQNGIKKRANNGTRARKNIQTSTVRAGKTKTASPTVAKDIPAATTTRTQELVDPRPANMMEAAKKSKIAKEIVEETDELPTFEAVAGAKGSKRQKTLVQAMKEDIKLTKAAKDAQQTGKELNYFARENASGRSVGIELFDPKKHRIEAGFVIDEKGNVIGNHIKVDETGIQVNVGGDLVDVESIIGNPVDWKGRYELSSTQSRNIDRLAPNKKIAETTKEWLIGSKVKAEANYRVELKKEFATLKDRIKRTNKAKPRNVKQDEWNRDIFGTLDGKISDADIRKTYQKPAADAILSYKKETRALYNSLLDRINAERVKFGRSPIEARKDYITHLTELSQNKSFVGDVYNNIRNSFTDEGMARTRGKVPAQIVGRTEDFKPISAYNKFLQRRTGAKTIEDPFQAVQEYLEPALYNIHMTEPTVRARAIESAFRTAGELKSMTPEQMLGDITDIANKYKTNSPDDKITRMFTEYANALARKTQKFDRDVIDASAISATALRGWQFLQRQGGRATIVGNVSSALAQPLNQVATLADAQPRNYIRGTFAALTGDKAIEKSTFIKARMTKPVAPIRGKFDKAMDIGGVPLEQLELASVKNTWHVMHAKAKSKGLTGMRAIQQADFDTERLVAGRGIADRPELYRSTITSGLLQYTLEVNAQNKVFWRDLSVSQKATFIVAAAGVNAAFGVINGTSPLPDFLKATVDSVKDFTNDDERSTSEKVGATAQRFGGEVVGMNPLTSAAANTALDQQQRKNIFGDESNLGMFEGTAAPIQLIRNTVDGTTALLDGNTTEARNDLIRTLPMGNQARKTIQGAEALYNGYTQSNSGNVQTPIERTPANTVRGLLFGQGGFSEQQDFYANNGKTLTEKQSDTFRQTGTLPGKSETGLKVVGKTTEKDAYGKYISRDKYDAMLDAYSKDKAGNLKINSYDSKDLVKANREIGKELNSELSKLGLPQIKTDSTTAQIWAKYKVSERDGKIGELEKDSKQRSVFKNIYRSRVSKTANEFFGISSDAEMERIIESGKVTKEQLDEAIALDNFLTESGLQSYMQIGKELRAKLGYGSPSSSKSSRSGGSSGGRSTGLTQAELNKYLSAASKTANVDIPQFATSAPRQLARPQITQIQRRGSTSRSTAAPRVSIRKGIRLA